MVTRRLREQTDERLREAFGDLTEAPPKDSGALTAQRNVPREVVNVMTSNQALRLMVWVISSVPKGAQAARLMRYLEDKGWRIAEVSGKRLLYHNRSFKMAEPPRPPTEWTVYSVYSMFSPRTADDHDYRSIDPGLVKLWGMRPVPTGDEVVINRIPSARFIRTITSEVETEKASGLADQLHLHTGIVLEPVPVKFPVGKPVSAEQMPRQELPMGVETDDVVVMATGGGFRTVRAIDFRGKNTLPASTLDTGRVDVGDRGPSVDMSRADPGESGLGSDYEQMMKRYGVKVGQPTPAKAASDQGDDTPEGPSIEGDSGLWRAYQRALALGRPSIFLVSQGEGEIDTHPISFRYSRTGIYGEDARVARNVRETGGLPVSSGKWKTDDLGKYIRMFQRDYGTTL